MNIPSLSTQITTPHPIRMFLVVSGGWYAPFMARGLLHVLDRNVVSSLRPLAAPPRSDSSVAVEWNLSFLNLDGVQVNPLLCSAEGNLRRPPVYSEFRLEMQRAVETLREKLPNAKIVEWSDAEEAAVFHSLAGSYDRTLVEAQLLAEVAPKLDNLRREHRSALELQVLERVRTLGIRPSPLLIYAILSAIYGGSAALGVLKPRASRALLGAYGALTDLRYLEFLLGGTALKQYPPLSFTTMDKALASFAVSLHASDVAISDTNGHFSLTWRSVVNTALFPALATVEFDRVAALLATF